MPPRLVNEKEWVWTILGLALLFGIFVRVLPAFLDGQPINDGGMFAVMMRDLRSNHFLLPGFTTYNYSEIPFAYPPLGLYLGALAETFGVPEFQALLWLPAFFASVTVPLFYLLADELLGNRPRAAAATVFFALAPGNYVWYLMGGGLTRALGADFLILSLYFVHRAFRELNWRYTLGASLFCALAVLSHPQAALLTGFGFIVFWLFSADKRVSTVRALAISLITVLLTSAWWGMIVSRHGLDVFVSAGQSGDLRASLSALWSNLTSRQTILPFATLFWLLGAGWAVFKRRFELLLWGFLPYALDQRSASIVTSFLYPMLAAYGLMDVVPTLIYWLRNRAWRFMADDALFNQRVLSMSLLGITFYLLIECFVHAYVIQNIILPYSSQNMMAWVRENTPADGRFLILTGRDDVMTDPVQEWFPALAERHSASTLQGLEWTLHSDFAPRWIQLAGLQSCKEAECVTRWAERMGLEYDYIILSKVHIPADEFLSAGYVSLFDNGQYIVLK